MNLLAKQFTSDPVTLLTETETIERLALGDRKNPVGALRWLVRTKKLKAVRIGRGILRYHPDDVQAFIDNARD